MGKFKLIKLSEVKLDLKCEGEYNKFKVAKKIALAANQAKADGLNLNPSSWKSVWDKKSSKWITNHDHNWCGILASVLLYSNCNFRGSKFEAVANILGIEEEWLIGFSSTLSENNKSRASKISQRKSLKGQQCRDGMEFGKLFKLAYFPQNFFEFRFSKTNKIFYDSHKWEPLEEFKVFISLGINYNPNIKKCSECNFYGGTAIDSYYKTNYYINENWNNTKKTDFTLNLSCNEIIIKKLLS